MSLPVHFSPFFYFTSKKNNGVRSLWHSHIKKPNTVLVQSLPFRWLCYISTDQRLLTTCCTHTHPFTSLFLLPLPQVDSLGDSLGTHPPPQPLWPPLPSPLSLTARQLPARLHFRCFNRPSNSKMAHNKCVKVALPCSAAPPLRDPCHSTHTHTHHHTHTLPMPTVMVSPSSLSLPCFSWYTNEPLKTEYSWSGFSHLYMWQKNASWLFSYSALSSNKQHLHLQWTCQRQSFTAIMGIQVMKVTCGFHMDPAPDIR